jgi:D-alanyl-D-alanine carboxypeptidase/D-alanyl-D-alanine-endopeptidase (penicillin-binding protein 4)
MYMRVVQLFFLLLAVVSFVECIPFPESAINAELANPILKQSTVGIQVTRLTGNKPAEKLFERNAQQMLMPASNNKVYTCAAIWSLLGDQWTVNTQFEAVEGDSKNVLKELRVVGKGDPTWDYASMMRLGELLGSKYSTTHIETIIIDDKYFDGVSR